MRKSHKSLFFLLVLAGLIFSGCTSTALYTSSPEKPSEKKDTQEEVLPEGWTYMNASFYGEEHHGKLTANGEVFDMYALTCAHKTLPFGTVLIVMNEEKQLETEVRVNDRGPFIDGRDLDLSYGAAQKIEMVADGVKKLRVRIKQ